MGDFEERLKAQGMQAPDNLPDSNAMTDPRTPAKVIDPDLEAPVEQPLYKNPKKNGLKQLVILAGVVIVILVIVSLVLNVGVFSSNKISEKQLIVGAALTMEENKSLKVEVGEEEHEIQVENVGDDWAEIVIRSDIRVKLFKIQDGKAIIAVKRIDKEACQEEWSCGDWGGCISDKRERICTDANNCGSEFFIPKHEQRCVGSNPVDTPEDENVRPIRRINQSTMYDSLNDSDNDGDEINNNIFNDNPGGSTQYGECGDGICNPGENTSSYPYYCPEDCGTNTGENDLPVVNSDCAVGEYLCDERTGVFCRENIPHINYFDDPWEICCPSECIDFESEEQFCDIRGLTYFNSNETHVCAERDSRLFNYSNILCCSNIKERNPEGVNFNFTKTNYEVGEFFSEIGTITSLSVNDHEDIFTMVFVQREGFEEKYFSGRGTTGTIGFNAFSQREGSSPVETYYFTDPGTHTFKVKIYDCADTAPYETYSCGDDFYYEGVELTPLFEDSISVVVTGNPIDFECNTDSECTEPCENCKDGVMDCINKRCVDCFTNYFCNEGYSCFKGECIP